MRLATERMYVNRTFDPKILYNGSGNSLVMANITGWGANAHFLTNGGGAIHWSEHIRPYEILNDLASGRPTGIVVNETAAAHAVIAHYLASGRIAVCDVTTGGAAAKAISGIAEAKFHQIPSMYFAALSPENSRGWCPLQDTSEDGFNTIGIMKALFGEEGCLVIDKSHARNSGKIEEMLYRAQERLLDSRPVAVLYHPEVMREEFPWVEVPWRERPRKYDGESLDKLMSNFETETNGKRIVIFVGEEAVRYEGIQELTTSLSRILHAPTIYTQIGVSAVSPDNEFAAGHVMLGYNDYALKLWESLTTNDTMICVGLDPFEYCTNQEKINANGVIITNYDRAYGTLDGTFKHRFWGNYTHVKGDLELALREMIYQLKRKELDRPRVDIPDELNEDRYKAPPEGFTNMSQFYSELARLMKPGTFYCADVCMGYKDLQRVNPRPIKGVKPLYVHQGSLMGKTGGELMGLRYARPDMHIVGVTGDGCMEYFGASLGRMKDLGLVLFVIDNGTHGLVDWGLSQIKPHLSPAERLTHVPRNDYVGMAVSQGWRGYPLRDLSDLEGIMKKANSDGSQSMIIQVPVHPDDDLGQNRRLKGLKNQGQEGIVTM